MPRQHIPKPNTPDSYSFAFASMFGLVLRVIGVRPDSCGLQVHDG